VATIINKVDRGVEPGLRYQYWASGAIGVTINQGDIFDVQATLGRPAKYMYLETSPGCDLEIRLNSQIKHVPMRDSVLNYPNRPAIEDTAYSTDSSMTQLPIGANEVWELDGTLPIIDVQIVVWTAGTFEILFA
jgi:hypothetical protein